MIEKDLTWIALQSATGIADSMAEAMMIGEAVFGDDGRVVDLRYIAVNSLYEPMTGLAARPGQTILSLAPEFERYWLEIVDRVVRGREAMQVENGSAALGRWFRARFVPSEIYPRYIVLFRDITAERQAQVDEAVALDALQGKLDRSQDRLSASEAEKAELRHRMINTLAIIASITAMEARQMLDREGRAALGRVRDRVAAAGELFRSLEGRDVPDTVSAAVFFGAIAAGLRKSLAGGAEISTSLVPVEIQGKKAVPLGLILNELVTNAVKYGAAPGETPIVEIGLRTDGGRVLLSVSDRGPGFSDDPGAHEGSGLGQRLIETFATQIGARVDRSSGANGTTVVVDFPA